MEIKVKNTRQYSRANEDTYDFSTILVVEAKLVLIKPTVYWFKPFLFSETEKIEEGDWAYNKISNTIFQVREIDNSTGRTYLINTGVLSPEENSKKVLALPEHFSKEQLNMIVDGKLKDGSIVLIECELQGPGFPDTIKSPLSIYPIEEKLYTKVDIMEMFNQIPPNENGTKLKWSEIKAYFQKNLK